jgi:hypothetical protein
MIDDRLAPLLARLAAGRGECPFIAGGPDAAGVKLVHYDGGRDVVYVVVSHNVADHLLGHVGGLGDLSVTIRYAPFVEGTALVYDLTDETMQGKARPFECRLTGPMRRVFAILPFQLEAVSVRVDHRGAGPRVVVSFLDAGGETIRAALPFERRLLDSRGKQIAARYDATSRQGFAVLAAPFADRTVHSIVVRSLLTGQEQKAAVR